MRVLCQSEQASFYSKEIKALKTGKNLSTQSNLLPLYPFFDDGFLKVGGRLQQSVQLSDNQKFPVILPKESHLSYLIVKSTHENFLHAGQNVVLAETRSQFWIVNARTLIRKTLKNCVKCFRFNSLPHEHLMI